jgi:hypothetical protein
MAKDADKEEDSKAGKNGVNDGKEEELWLAESYDLVSLYIIRK